MTEFRSFYKRSPLSHDISNLVYSDQSTLIPDPVTPTNIKVQAQGWSVSENGQRFYIDSESNKANQYRLNPPYSIDSVFYDNKFTSSIINNDLAIDSPESTLFALESSNRQVQQYTFSTPRDISTATPAGKSFPISSNFGTNIGQSIFVGNNGTEVYVLGTNGDLYQYTLGTSWDASTKQLGFKFLDVTQNTFLYGIEFNPNGTRMIIGEVHSARKIHQYTLSTPWDISTATSNFTLSTPEVTGVHGMKWDTDGTELLVLSNISVGNHRIYRYTYM
ncbi:MAG: hypothetical protein DRQ56_04225 [Gammaproteobacteria bacterium]|nr:MAG: hypothetical protein DRQ56_04225 [Gammaproteobacteria bacterium]